MTKETKNTVSAETIVENLKEFAETLHDAGKKGMLYYLLTEDGDGFKTAKTMHSVSHDLLDILDGKTVKEVLEEVDENEEDSSLAKEQVLAAVSKVIEELGGN